MQLILISECKTVLSKQSDCTKFERFLYNRSLMANNFILHGLRACELCHFLDQIYKRCEELYKEKYGNFANLVKNCPFTPQESIFSHVNSVFSIYTANSDFPTPLEPCPISTTSAIRVHLFKNSTWLGSRTAKKQVPSCSCLRSPNRSRITRCRTLF